MQTVESPDAPLVRDVEARVRAAGGDFKELRQILLEFAHVFGGIAMRYQPRVVDGVPQWRDDKHIEMFLTFSHRANIYAHWGAPYFHPTYKAIMIAPQEAPQSGDNAKLVNLRVFEHGGKVVAVSED